MLQIDVHPYASDALEDAMRLAQTKALNSFNFSDCFNYLNYAWMDMYQKLALIDEGYYSVTTRLTERITKLPPFFKNSIKVYGAQAPNGFNRITYKASGYADLEAPLTYHISGFDLYCPDAVRRPFVWLNYIPMQPQIFFTMHNRDPKIYETYTPRRTDIYGMYELIKNGDQYIMQYRNRIMANQDLDITTTLQFKGDDWELIYITCDFPYVFCTYRNKFTDDHQSGFFKDIISSSDFIEYNPFAFTGRNSNVEYIDCKWNDKTGMGVVIIDHNDQNRIKELGWTPDTLMNYPCPEMYRLLVALLAQKFASLNESDVMGVQRELVEATYAFQAFCAKDKSSWQRIDNVQRAHWGDWL